MWRGLDPFAAKREVSRMRRFNAGGVGPSAHRARRGSIAVIAIALSVAVIGIASVGSASAAPPSSAAAASAADGLTLEKVSDSGAVKSKRATFCRNVGYIYGSKNILRQYVAAISSYVNWCWNGSTHRITSRSYSRNYTVRYLWNFDGWDGTRTSGGVGYTSLAVLQSAHFSECTGYCFHHYTPWLKVTVDGYGRAGAVGGTYSN